MQVWCCTPAFCNLVAFTAFKSFCRIILEQETAWCGQKFELHTQTPNNDRGNWIMDMKDVVENCHSSPLWTNLPATSCLATLSLLRKVSHSRINREFLLVAWKPVRITNALCDLCVCFVKLALILFFASLCGAETHHWIWVWVQGAFSDRQVLGWWLALNTDRSRI